MKKATPALLLAIAVALIGFSPRASLAETPSNYVVLKGGLYSPSETFRHGTTDFNLDDGFVVEIAYGRHILPVLALELGAGYFESKGSPAVAPGEVKVKVVPVTATAKGLLPLGPVEPYGEFGIGAYFTDGEVSGSSDPTLNVSASTKTSFGLHAGAGVNINITSNLFLGVEGRYLWAKPSIGGDHLDLNGFTVTGDLGLRF
jgi:opacity protein-like surface antigen